ncbi:hypothetical protein SCHIN_v1c10970 [Spiroplasma chinense]|uniref:Uncharacterized protein n=1 Tax=Spiroplasma chinense TaxID=216932 RepID=A0A5B9Y5Q7_9MOLU|nr:hypothetical protein SCHIN_v1c10970 [Spiroplasma chinense]
MHSFFMLLKNDSQDQLSGEFPLLDIDILIPFEPQISFHVSLVYGPPWSECINFGTPLFLIADNKLPWDNSLFGFLESFQSTISELVRSFIADK